MTSFAAINSSSTPTQLSTPGLIATNPASLDESFGESVSSLDEVAISNIRVRVLDSATTDQRCPEDGELIEIVLNHDKRSIGRIQIEFSSFKSAELLEAFITSHPSRIDPDGDAILSPTELSNFLNNATNAGGRIRSALGESVEAIVATYESRLAGAARVVTNAIEIHGNVVNPANVSFDAHESAQGEKYCPAKLTWIDAQGEAEHTDDFFTSHGVKKLPSLAAHKRDNTKSAIVHGYLVGEVGVFAVDPSDADKVIRHELQFLLDRNLLVTSHLECSNFVRKIQAQFPEVLKISHGSGADSGGLLCWMLGEVIKQNTSVLDNIEWRINDVKKQVVLEKVPPEVIRKSLPDLAVTLQYFQRKQREMFGILDILDAVRLEEGENNFFSNGISRNLLTPVRQRLNSLIERAQEMERRVDSAGETHDRIRGSKTDANILRLTAVAAILVPLEISKFVAEGVPWGQVTAVILMAGAMLFTARRKNWW